MGKRILVVDDQETIILFLRNRLDKIGFEVTTASNGLEGFKVLKAESVNGIFLDLEMPIMDGFDDAEPTPAKICSCSGDRDVCRSHSIDDE